MAPTHPSAQAPDPAFQGDEASAYDNRFAKLAPFKEALHLVLSMALADLPVDARVLCVGVGTGAELLTLGPAHPGWHFVGVEPAPAMIRQARAKTTAAGISCVLHEGTLDSLPRTAAFDAVTCLLVGHFLVDDAERAALLANMASRLRPGGRLVHATLATRGTPDGDDTLLNSWLNALRYAGFPPKRIASFRDALGTRITVLPRAQIEDELVAAGFESPALVFQSLLMHGWTARRAPTTSSSTT